MYHQQGIKPPSHFQGSNAQKELPAPPTNDFQSPPNDFQPPPIPSRDG